MRDNSIGSWIKGWRHLCGRSAIDTLCHFSQMESLYVRSFEEVGYKKRLSELA